VVSDMTGTTSRDSRVRRGLDRQRGQVLCPLRRHQTYKGETPTAATCNWTFSGGTGKLRGLTGKGTCTGSGNQLRKWPDQIEMTLDKCHLGHPASKLTELPSISVEDGSSG